MLSNVHSRTAEATAAIRACHYQHDQPHLFVDPYAVHLTSPVWRMVCRHRWLYRVIVRGLLAALRPVHGWILVRDRLTEEVLRSFANDGGRQFVLLGAGFDSTALRRPAWLHAVAIYEIDHPATQAVKLARIAALEGAAAAAEFEAIAIDFEHEGLGDGLARSNFDPATPALFAWQGVIYYLSSGAIKEILRELGTVAAPGSELLFDFLLPEWTLEAGSGRVLSFARLFTARLGERYVSYHTVEDVRALLAEAGFEVLSIRLDAELERAYLNDRADGLTVMRGFGIAHARKCAT
ncbi:MAG: SAM-dependent methyltransferase [Gammaproteobacteria bacterium]